MPNKLENFNRGIDKYVSQNQQGRKTVGERLYRQQAMSDAIHGTPEQRIAQAKAKQAEVPALNLRGALTELLDFPGTTVNVTPQQIESANYFLDNIVPKRQATPPPFGIKPVVDTRGTYAQNLGKSLIVDNLYKSITDLEKEGVNDDNIVAFNKIAEEIDNYSTKAIDYQTRLADEIYSTRNTISSMKRSFGAERDYILPDPSKYPAEFEDAIKTNTKDVNKIESVFSGIQKKLGEMKAPYLGKKFLEEYREFAIKDPFQRYTNNSATQFNKLFDPNKSWKDNDLFVKAMQSFAFENASPGEDIYTLKPEDREKILSGADLTESERVVAKSLEDRTLNGIANYFYKEMKTLADTGNVEAIKDYETALDNINKRVSNSNKDYDIDTYNKFERSIAQFRIQIGRGFRSIVSYYTPFYEYEPDAQHLGNDIKYGPVPVDLNKDGTLDIDKYGNLILSNQFTYTKKDGSLGFNSGAIPELSAAVIGQMAPILILDAVTKGVGGKLARASKAAGFLGTAGKFASSFGKRWNAVNAWNGLRLADRVSTFGLVTGSVYSNMYQDELRWTKDRDVASKRAFGRSVVEGLTEAIGAPEVGMFSATRFDQSVARGLLSMFTPLGATTTQKLTNFMLNSARVGKLAATQSITESLEEEMSLYGNYLLGKMIKSGDESYKKEDEFTPTDVVQTFLDSLAGMAPYSLLGVGIQQAAARNKLGPEHETLWDMANNPDHYKVKIKELLNKKKYTPEQAAQALQVVAEAKSILDSIPEFANIKDLRTLLSDKDAQKKYFHDVLYKNKLQSINYEELNDEQKKALKNTRLIKLFEESANERLEELSKQETLTKEDQQEKAYLETMKNVTFVSTHEFTQAEKKKLVDLGILKEDNFKNSPEDLLEEIKSVDKSILKNKKRVDQFVNMTDEEKEKTVAKLFQEQIDSVQTLSNPKVISDRIVEITQQLEFVKTMPPKYKTEQTGRQALIQALEEKLGQEIAINPETGRNKFTEDLLEEDVSGDSVFQSQNRIKNLKANADFVNEEDYAQLMASYEQNRVQKIYDFVQLPQEQKEEALVEILKEAADTNLDSLFELETLKKAFTLQNPQTGEVLVPEISQETFDAAKEKALGKRVEERKQQAAASEAPVEVETEDQERDAFTPEEQKGLETRQNVGEDGKFDDTFIANLFEKHNKTNDKTSTLSKEAFANKLIRKTKDMLELAKIKADPVIWAKIVEFISNTVTGVYDSNKMLSESKAILDAVPSQYRDKITGVFDLAKYAAKFFLVNKKRRSIQPKTEEEEAPSPKKSSKLTLEDAPPQTPLQQQANAEATPKEKALVERQNAVIQLQIPSSTYGFEVPENNELSEDPAIQRNANILRFLVQQDYSTFKVRITSRLNFLQQLAANQGLDFQDFVNLLNEAHEAYKAIKGSPAKKAEQIAPMLKQLNDFFGEDFFEQTLSSGRNLPELLYMVERNGANLSDPILTIVNSAGAIQSFDGYPFYTNIDSDPQILEKEDTKRLPYWENILGERVAELQQFVPIKEAVVKLAKKIKTDPTHSEDFPISRITQGTFITATETLVPLQESGLEVTEENIQVLKNAKQKLGNETIAGVPGQTFIVVNDSPVVLMNDKVDELEAEALAAMVFDKTLREQFFPGEDAAEEAEKLKQHIAKTLNIYQKQGRKVVFAFDQETQELVPFIPGVSGSQLNQEQLTKLFKELYYNVSKGEVNSMVPRFSMQEGEVVKVKDQTYVDFVKSTNKVYMTGNTPGVRRNQRIIFDMGVSISKTKAAPQPKAKTGPQQTPAKKKGPAGKLSLKDAEEQLTEDQTDEALAILDSKRQAPGNQELLDKIAKNKKRAELVEEVDENGKEVSYYLIDGNRYERVSSEIDFGGDKESFATKRATTVGRAIDTILRDVFAGRTPTKPDLLSAAAFKFITNQATVIYNALKDNYIINTDEIILWDEDAKIAGAIDMLLINKETGEVDIVDFKTSKWYKKVKENILGYSSEANGYVSMAENPKSEHISQQNSYGVMFARQYGITPGLNIMYIKLSFKDEETFNVTSATILTENGQPALPIPVDKTLVIPSLQENAKPKLRTKQVVTLQPAEEAPAPVSTDAKAAIEERRQEELKNNNGSTVKNEVYSIPILRDNRAKVRGDIQRYVTREIVEKAYNNDDREGANYQTLDTLIRRGAYSIEELNDLLPNWKELLPSTEEINAKYDAELAALETVAPATESKVEIQMQPDNIKKIKAGVKTTTVRSAAQAKQINIPVGQSAIVNFDGQDFKVTNRGALTIEEAGGKDAIIKSEGVKSENDFMYKQTKDWVNGKGKLYVYDIVPVEAKPAETIVTDFNPTRIEESKRKEFAKKVIDTLGGIKEIKINVEETQIVTREGLKDAKPQHTFDVTFENGETTTIYPDGGSFTGLSKYLTDPGSDIRFFAGISYLIEQELAGKKSEPVEQKAASTSGSLVGLKYELGTITKETDTKVEVTTSFPSFLNKADQVKTYNKKEVLFNLGLKEYLENNKESIFKNTSVEAGIKLLASQFGNTPQAFEQAKESVISALYDMISTLYEGKDSFNRAPSQLKSKGIKDFVNALFTELNALEVAPTQEAEPELSQEEKENYSPLAASLTVQQIEAAEKQKNNCEKNAKNNQSRIRKKSNTI
jgi:hypothetical protein